VDQPIFAALFFLPFFTGYAFNRAVVATFLESFSVSFRGHFGNGKKANAQQLGTVSDAQPKAALPN
jgi:hypothetical protein